MAGAESAAAAETWMRNEKTSSNNERKEEKN